METIYAAATPPGRGGVVIVRVSGPMAFPILERLCGLPLPLPRVASLRRLNDPATHELIDRAMVLRFPAPHSFTGEDVAEYHLHGGQAVLRHLLAVMEKEPETRLAQPGEFSRRAVLRGKMDLVSAEGMADLIDADTPAQKAQALRQSEGEHARFYESLRSRVLVPLAYLEALIDFPDEDIPPEVWDDLMRQVDALRQDIAHCLDDRQRGQRLREGCKVAIVGEPNVGKSSLLNLLAGRDAAIVSPVAGTTRDVIEVQMQIGGYPVSLVDTAGIRESSDIIEQEGVRRARAAAESADIRILMIDASSPPACPWGGALEGDRTQILVRNKADLLHAERESDSERILAISCATGDGVENLLAQLGALVGEMFISASPAYITRQRHRDFLVQALKHLDEARKSGPMEIVCEELRAAAHSIGRITGKIVTDDILDEIFRSFCIGK
jgi:tRNA modification GTPase